MQISRLSIPSLLLVEPAQIRDTRGCLAETFRANLLRAAAGLVEFVQENHSVSVAKGTVRGFHYQKEPRSQGKLVRVTRGSILDVAVDIRQGSPTYGRHEAVELSAENWRQLWVPPGFLHAFCTLVDNVEVIYKLTDYYSPEHDAGVRWNDPDIGISWPVAETEARLSDKDRVAPFLRNIGQQFLYFD